MKNRWAKNIIFTSIVCSINTLCYAQVQKQTIVKTNTLNLLMLPSVHLEQQISRSGSIQGNFHRGSLIFISANEWIHTSIDYRKYFNKSRTPTLEGFYISSGINLYHNYLASRVDKDGSPLGRGKSDLGIQCKAGYQWIGKKERVTFDLGTGFLVSCLTLQESYYNDTDVILRLHASLGYNIGGILGVKND
jgi:hypothetical protein